MQIDERLQSEGKYDSVVFKCIPDGNAHKKMRKNQSYELQRQRTSNVSTMRRFIINQFMILSMKDSMNKAITGEKKKNI